MGTFEELFQAYAFADDGEGGTGLDYPVWRTRQANGPPVILLHEIDGVGVACRALAVHLAGQGFRVHVPAFFKSLAPEGKRQARRHARRGMLRVCVRREFACFATRKKSRVADWVRALAAHIAADERAERGVGVIGMCLTGGVALATVAEPAVGAAVAAQQSLPWSPESWRWPLNRAVRQHSLGLPDDELYEAVSARTPVMLVRFADDPICPPDRAEFQAACFRVAPLDDVVVPTGAVPEEDRATLHATLTGPWRTGPDERYPELYEKVARDTEDAVARVVAFLMRHL